MTDTLTEPTTKDLTATPITTPLVIPKLRPKFRVIYYLAREAKSPTLASGISKLEDAVKIAWALAENRKEGSTMVYAKITRARTPHVRQKEETIVANISCDYARRQNTSAFNEIADAKRTLETWAKEMAIADQRWNWIKANLGGISSPRCNAVWDDGEFRRALFSNDFANAWNRVLQLESERQVAA